MAYNSVATFNDLFESAGAGAELYVWQYPTGGYAGGTLATAKAALYVLAGYTDGTKKTPMTGLKWGCPDTSGMEFKMKVGTVELEKLNGPKHPILYTSSEISISTTLADVDEAHVKDFLSATSGEEITIAAGVGQYGSKTVFGGSQRLIRQFGLMVRIPAVMAQGGTVNAWDHFVCPKVVMVPELDLKFNKKDPLLAKLQFTALADSSFVSPDNNQPEVWFYEQANAVAT